MSLRDNVISEFQGEFRFLSNFWPAKVSLDGLTYPTVENAYQAAKTTSDSRKEFQHCSPGLAKRLGRVVRIRDDWDSIKLIVMKDLIAQKFADNTLGYRLLLTGTRELIEGNSWGDTFWGVCNGKGENHLGRILMERRSELNAART